jgi:alkylation response protein AidB-like acyl-CoA dehydrogenase
MKRAIFEEEHELFREAVRSFLERHAVPHYERWEAEGIVDRALFEAAGEAGFLGMAIDEEFGGGGMEDFRFNAIIDEEIQHLDVGAAGLGLSLHTDICVPYFTSLATAEQKARWLPGVASGELICAIGMTEPGTGSDLAGIRTTAIRDGDSYIVNGAKTFITNGINADLVIAAVKTDPTERHRGLSLLVIERGMEGFERGRNLSKLGNHAQDTAELFFSDVRVPAENLLGIEGQGFAYLAENLPQERLSIAITGVAAARRALELTVDYVKGREAFGTTISTFQNTQFRLAELATEVEVGTAFIDRAVIALNDGELTAEEAAMAKLWATELQGRATDVGVQLHGGYGYMTEYPIARAFADARVTRIYGGSNEIMRQIVGRKLLGR